MSTAPLLNFVLVHGAFHGGWCWRDVAARLLAAGAGVFTPTMTGLGERAHLLSRAVGIETFFSDVIGLIAAEELTNVVLVGHSFGGVVISGVVDRMPDPIRQLIYLDALVPQNGRSAISLLPPETAATRIRAAEASSNGLSIPVPKGDIFDLPPGTGRDWVARRITPHPLAAYTDQVRLAAPVCNGRRCSYIRCTDPVYPAVVPSYDAVAGRPDWTVVDLPTGHDAMISAPESLANLLLKLAG